MFKKILASTLAMAMVAGMSVTAFAEESPLQEFFDDVTDEVVFLHQINEINVEGGGVGPWHMVEEDNTTDVNESVDIKALKPGDKIATPLTTLAIDISEAQMDFYEFMYDMILEETGSVEDTNLSFMVSALQASGIYAHEMYEQKSESVKGYKAEILFDNEEGEELIEEIKIEPIVMQYQDELLITQCVTIEFVADASEIDPEDLVGRVVVYKRSKAYVIEGLQEMQLNADRFATVGYDSIAYDDAGFDEITSGGAPVRDFSDAATGEQIDLYFDGVGIFYTANIGDEGAKYLGFNMNPDHELLAQYPDADMEFINFPGMVQFNRFGTFELFKQENQFAYAVVDGEIVTLESIARGGKVVDGIDEGYSLVLSIKDFPESFILSDMELELTEAEDEEVVEDAVDAEPAA